MAEDEISGWDPSGPELLYVLVADHIEGQIRRGDLPVGSRLRAERDLAEMYGVSYKTIRRATEELRARGLIRTIHGKGTYVIRKPDEAAGE